MSVKRLIILLVTVAIPFFAYAERRVCHGSGLSEKCSAVITGTNVNVRSKPSTGGAKLFQLNAGDIVYVQEICKEEMYVDNAYANWVKIKCSSGEGYVCSRWMTAYFVDLENESLKVIEYLAYEYFFSEPEDYNPDRDWDEIKILRDNFIHITERRTDREVVLVKGVSWVPENSNILYCPPRMTLIRGLGLYKDPVLLFRGDLKYGAGYCTNVEFYTFNGKDRLEKIVSEKGLHEGGYYRETYINFPNKCYDVLGDKWVGHTTSLKNKGQIVITVKKMENDIVSEEEYIPGR